MNRDKKDKNEDDSDYDWVEEPQMYQSSSGESKYSNEDREQKDHLAIDEVALNNSIKKYKNADKIVQINEAKKQDDLTSHLVKYYQHIDAKGIIPKSFGMVHRKNKPNELNAGAVMIDDDHAEAIAKSLNRARYINKLLLRNVGLRDD